MSDRYAQFKHLLLDRPAPGVIRITINNPTQMNALNPATHDEIVAIWAVIDNDPEIRCSIITGAGKAFCAGGAVDEMPTTTQLDVSTQVMKDFRSGSSLVKSLIDARKPIVSAINGAAVGAGLALALLCDVPIASKTAKIFDGHTRIGVAAGDHAALIWPLLCGMAKSKFYLFTNEVMTGEEAERNNLVALAVDPDKLADRAVEVAAKIASLAPTAIRITKYTLNHWLRQAMPIFDLSLALELTSFHGAEAKEAMAAMMEKRAASFPEDSSF
ncbi:MAG: enoyl-CoA hydratase/isomerase family protein [Spongiibacteraceae bacterium]